MKAKELLESKGIKDTLYNDGTWTKGALSDLMEEYATQQVNLLNKPAVSSSTPFVTCIQWKLNDSDTIEKLYWAWNPTDDQVNRHFGDDLIKLTWWR
jgi:hypothetical protein